MHVVDIVALCLAAVVIVGFALVLGRQRQMLRTRGAVPIALARGSRWLYGVGRYVDDELRWYRALGVATRPSLVLCRSSVEVLDRRARHESERGALPASATVVTVRDRGDTWSLAIGDNAYTGFISWVESSAPR